MEKLTDARSSSAFSSSPQRSRLQSADRDGRSPQQGPDLRRQQATLGSSLGGAAWAATTQHQPLSIFEVESYHVTHMCRAASGSRRKSLGSLLTSATTGQQLPLSTVVSIQTRDDPNSLTHSSSSTRRRVSAGPMPGVTVARRSTSSKSEAKTLPQGFSHDYLATPGSMCGSNHLAITFASRWSIHLPGAAVAVRELA